MTKEEKIFIKNFGAFKYDINKMANILDWPPHQVKTEFENKESEYRKLYEQGRDTADFLIDKKLYDLAKDGDLKALEEFETRRDER